MVDSFLLYHERGFCLLKFFKSDIRLSILDEVGAATQECLVTRFHSLLLVAP